MAEKQHFGIKYPFASDNVENVYMDLNDTYEEAIKSQVLHVLFTPKGQKLRDPEFGTNLISYIFEPGSGKTLNGIMSDLRESVKREVPNVELDDIKISPDTGPNETALLVSYKILKGGIQIKNNVLVKL